MDDPMRDSNDEHLGIPRWVYKPKSMTKYERCKQREELLQARAWFQKYR